MHPTPASLEVHGGQAPVSAPQVAVTTSHRDSKCSPHHSFWDVQVVWSVFGEGWAVLEQRRTEKPCALLHIPLRIDPIVNPNLPLLLST
jgi:hypothetical protein